MGDSFMDTTLSVFHTHPYLANVVMTASLWSLGDVLAQFLERSAARKVTHQPLNQHDPDTPSNAPSPASPTSAGFAYATPLSAAWRYSYFRTLRLALFAGLIFAPLTDTWFHWLSDTFPGEGLFVGTKRMLMDQLLYAPFMISLLFLWTGLLDSAGDWKHARRSWATNFPGALKTNYLVWPVAQMLIQGVVPIEGRMVVVCLINVPWTAYLAWKSSSSGGEAVGSRHGGAPTRIELNKV